MTATETSANPRPTELIGPVLDDLATLIGQVRPEQYGDPTPCPGYTVGGMRDHLLAWVTYFSLAMEDPSGETDRIDPSTFRAPEDPAEAADLVRAGRDRFATAIAFGVAERKVTFVQSEMPGDMVVAMGLGEFVAHGWDLAGGAGLPWSPPDAASLTAIGLLSSMLKDEYRGEGKDFGPKFPVPDDAPPLHQLLGFSGRDPNWQRPG